MKRMWSLKQLRDIADAQAKAVQKDIATLVDEQGHKRFIEGNGVPMESVGFTSSYCKWSLSGTHLMLVLAGTFENGASVPTATTFASYVLPKWVYDKIYPVFAETRIELKQVQLISDDWTMESSSPNLVLTVSNNLTITLVNVENAFTTTKERSFRVQFDLLIDNA